MAYEGGLVHGYHHDSGRLVEADTMQEQEQGQEGHGDEERVCWPHHHHP